jgi:hypothetical protein
MRAAKDSDHFCASSGCGRVDKGDSEILRPRKPDFIFKIRILDLKFPTKRKKNRLSHIYYKLPKRNLPLEIWKKNTVQLLIIVTDVSWLMLNFRDFTNGRTI